MSGGKYSVTALQFANGYQAFFEGVKVEHLRWRTAAFKNGWRTARDTKRAKPIHPVGERVRRQPRHAT
jgi:hypothetical protein